MKSQDPHFKFIYWFIVGNTALVFIYAFMITFISIPKESIRFADTILGFFLGSAFTAGLGYLLGGSINKATSKPADTTTDRITVTTETNAPANDTNNAGS